jgi:hypothetical protein
MFARLTRQRLWIALLILAALTLSLTGCALFGGKAAQSEVLRDEDMAVQEAPAEEEEAAFEVEAEKKEAAGESVPGFLGADEESGLGGGPAEEPPAPMPTAAALVEGEEAYAPDSAEYAKTESDIAPAPQQVLALKAGEIDDNAEWDDYLLFRREFLGQGWQVHDVDVRGRHVITVRTAGGLPVLGARVRVYAGQTLVSETRTYATGQTLFFPNATRDGQGTDSFEVIVEKDGQASEFTLNTLETNEWSVTLDRVEPASQQRVRLDVLFLIDATGSMADEIEQLQSNILSISEQIDAFQIQVETRYGMVTYRDIHDEYVTRVYDFTPDVRDFQADLSRVRAEGGDDYPESLNEALHDAVHGPEWRVDDTVSLMFLVADAPPHLDYSNDYDYAVEMAEAARLGIKIHPIASSGLDPQGEFIFRQIAQYTMGHFIFLTYEGEQGEYARPELSADEQDYSVEALDELVLRLIGDELDALFGE